MTMGEDIENGEEIELDVENSKFRHLTLNNYKALIYKEKSTGDIVTDNMIVEVLSHFSDLQELMEAYPIDGLDSFFKRLERLEVLLYSALVRLRQVEGIDEPSPITNKLDEYFRD